jgi:VanZ family protein
LSQQPSRAVYWIALAASAGFIVQVCLYPYQFDARHAAGSPFFILIHSWSFDWSRRGLADIIGNIVLYIPLGFFAQAAAGARRFRLAAAGALAASLVLSASIEMTQVFDATRTCSAVDLTTNVMGAGLGVALAFAARRTLERSWPRAPLETFLLFFAWAGYQLWPLMPQINLPLFRAALGGLASSPFSIPLFAETVAAGLALAALCSIVSAGLAGRLLLWGAVCLPMARLVMVGRNLNAWELVGAAAGALVWIFLPRIFRTPAVAATLLIAALIVAELSPYPLATAAGHFHWRPFEFVGDAESSPIALLKKAFLYGSAIVLLRRAGAGRLAAAVPFAALMTALEAAQTRIPGRTADITDPLIALFMAVAVYCTEAFPNAGGMPVARGDRVAVSGERGNGAGAGGMAVTARNREASRHSCPRCREERKIHRSRVRVFSLEPLRAARGLYPYRCEQCDKRFFDKPSRR